MPGKDQYIAVFDSGVGGISVLREMVRLMPKERFLYFGDSANAPYGDKTTQQVQQLTLDNAKMLVSQGIKALVVACNTATAAAITLLRQQYPDLIVVGIEPALKLAANRFPQGTVGVMATQVTLREEKLAHQMELFPQLQVLRIPAPGLVELIEQGKAGQPETKALLQEILLPYRGKLDALVLGCTHYPFVKDTIAQILGQQVCLLDGGEGTARHTKRCLEEAGLLSQGVGEVRLTNSLQDDAIIRLCQQLLEG